ncbi:Cytochrome [Trichinella pseudospiralis]
MLEWGLVGLRSSISYLLTTPYIPSRTCRSIVWKPIAIEDLLRVASCGKEETDKTETYRLSQVCFSLKLCG